MASISRLANSSTDKMLRSKTWAHRHPMASAIHSPGYQATRLTSITSITSHPPTALEKSWNTGKNIGKSVSDIRVIRVIRKTEIQGCARSAARRLAVPGSALQWARGLEDVAMWIARLPHGFCHLCHLYQFMSFMHEHLFFFTDKGS